jgi:sigma-B regulation protein RsbU (phosphoserine phosphatase)
VLNTVAGQDPMTIIHAVRADLDAFAEDAEQFDDITMLCLTYQGPVSGKGEN